MIDRHPRGTALATATRRLDPWPDTIEVLDRLALHVPVVGLTNASRATLAHLSARAGARWHFVLSAEDTRSYQPARTSIGSPPRWPRPTGS